MAETEIPRVLIVDDDEAAGETLVPALQGRGWLVERAATAADAVARLQAAWFDVVVMDLRLAGGECRGWLRRIRVLRPQVRLVATALENAPANVICAMREGAFCYIGKPFSPESVAEMVGQALETESWDDDIELVSAGPQWITVALRCKIEAAERLVQFLRELKADLAADKREDVAAALRELALNAVEHGGRNDPRRRIRVSYMRVSRAILYHIQDPGEGFSFSGLAHAAVANPPEDPARHAEIREERGVRPGGFGILLSRNLVDELIYNEKGNEVLFIKYLDAD
jgi:two-component system, OmpR family, response regulator